MTATAGNPPLHREWSAERFDVDGVPGFWLDVPGQLRAKLVFRIGMGDETVPMRGITHLVEHLAMFSLAHRFPDFDVAAHVGPQHTRFMVRGTEAQVCWFLDGVTASLCDLPLERLEGERRVLLTESENESGGSAKSLWGNRWGTRGIGAADFDEYGLRWLTAEHVADWSAKWFTAGNAALWLSGPVPDRLKLNLKEGGRLPVPALPPPGDFETPAVYREGDRWVALSMLAPRSPAARTATRVLDHRLRQRLRLEQSVAYKVHASAMPVAVDTTEIFAFADALAPNAAQAAESLVSVARSLAAEGPAPEELARFVDQWRRFLDDPQAGLEVLDGAVEALLEGREPMSSADILDRVSAVTADEVAAVVAAALETALLALPNGVENRVEGFTPLPPAVGEPVSGFQIRPARGSKLNAVIEYSDSAISLHSTDGTGRRTAMRWDEIAVAQWWRDGRRALTGTHGSGILVRPERWQNADRLLAQIQRKVPPHVWVPMDDPPPATS